MAIMPVLYAFRRLMKQKALPVLCAKREKSSGTADGDPAAKPAPIAIPVKQARSCPP